MSSIRTRFAPSPTGSLHVGGARTALFNWLFAKANGGEFILRIEDTDRVRSTEESFKLMVESMNWLGLNWGEGPKSVEDAYSYIGEHGPYHQSKRLELYKEYTQKLLDKDKIYRCFCTQEELDTENKRREKEKLPLVYNKKCANLSKEESDRRAETEPFVMRFRTPEKLVEIEDIVQGKVKFHTKIIGDFIIVKSDGFPSYNYAVVVDDFLMKISHVIRGVGHLSNIPRQILIYEAMNWPPPAFAHVSEIVGNDKKKLSKRRGATSVTLFRDFGYPVEAFVNYMALLGFMPEDENEFMPLERLSKEFSLERCHKNSATFDVFDLKKLDSSVDFVNLKPKEIRALLSPKSKLNWLSNQHLKAMPDEVYIARAKEYLNRTALQNPLIDELLLKLRNYVNHFDELPSMVADFTEAGDHGFIAQEATEWVESEIAKSLIPALHKEIENDGDFSEESLQSGIKTAGEIAGVEGKNLFMTARVAISGKTQGLKLPAYIRLLGKERTLNRLEFIAQTLKK